MIVGDVPKRAESSTNRGLASMADARLLMPRAGLTMDEGRVVSWQVQVGDRVTAGEPIAELETDKTVLALMAPISGYVEQILVPAGDVAAVGTALAEFRADDGSGTAPPSIHPRADVTERSRPSPRASPAAKRLARQLGVSLHSVPGSGPGGRVVARDIESAREARTSRHAAADEVALVAEGGRGQSEGEISSSVNGTVALSRMRQAVAAAVEQSWATIPQFQVRATADMTAVRRHVAYLRAAFADAAGRLSVTDFVLAALGRCLRAYPDLQAEFVPGDPPKLHYRTGVNIGMVVSVANGLLVPVLHDADQSGLLDLARQRRTVMHAIREGTLDPSQFGDAGFSLSNLGPEGVEGFSALCLPGQTAVLATGAVIDSAVAMAGAVVVRPVMQMTLTVDHRVVDGVIASRFLHSLREELEKSDGWTLFADEIGGAARDASHRT